ncbi:Zinc finger, RING-type [Sesbania bispinosa]|nr:Zinc finger, RING-type [Sesbania bispinosa]
MSSAPNPEFDTAPATVAYNTPPALIAFTLAVLVLCFVAFSIVYLCKHCFSNVIHTWEFQRTASGSIIRFAPHTSPPRGLDPSVLEGFPTFLYASVKDLRKEKHSLECAICLLEFEDDSMLRFLTVCCHVFHQECIDLWLRSHKTCPVCRADLDSMPKCEEENNNHNALQEPSCTDDNIRIDVKQGDASAGDQSQHQHQSMNMQQREEQRFARSHSTGHSIVMIRGGGGDEEKEDDKYTLRLPEHVIRGWHNNCTRSCRSCREMIGPEPCTNCAFLQPLSASSPLGHAQQS